MIQSHRRFEEKKNMKKGESSFKIAFMLAAAANLEVMKCKIDCIKQTVYQHVG
jgi:hypothetical protein